MEPLVSGFRASFPLQEVCLTLLLQQPSTGCFQAEMYKLYKKFCSCGLQMKLKNEQQRRRQTIYFCCSNHKTLQKAVRVQWRVISAGLLSAFFPNILAKIMEFSGIAMILFTCKAFDRSKLTCVIYTTEKLWNKSLRVAERQWWD